MALHQYGADHVRLALDGDPVLTHRLAVGLALLWLASLPLLTYLRLPIFSDERALWQDAVRGSPEKPRPRVNLGRMAHLAGDATTAAKHYELAIQLAQNPERPEAERNTGWAVATTNLALLALERGDLTTAAQLMTPIERRFPSFREAKDVLDAIHFGSR